ncbi:MAG: right-handed parallel beta-helix repeat-containing protein [Ruminococcaceae bacterium]|nr:right-handed parallel beta-helix repeat-containing protein [Oscillospiraceae bacterium]
MNELSTLFSNVTDNETIVLEKNKIYDVRQDDSFCLKGYYCSNTAKKEENPDGTRFTAIYLKEKKNITIDGNGACVLVHGKMTPILLDHCGNVTIKNLTLDYACPTMSEFKVLSAENGVCDIKINDDCLYKICDNELFWIGEKDENGNPYWIDSYHGNKRHIKVFEPETYETRDFRRADLNFTKIEKLDNNVLRVHFKNPEITFKEGTTIQTRNIIRDQVGSFFERCKNLHFENMRVKFMHGLGMVSQFCENVTFLNCDFTPAEHRTVASTADFFQFSGCRGQLKIQNCKAYGAHDDYVNVHGTHLRIIKANKREKSITVRFMHPESWGFQAFEIGDELEFIKWDTLKPYFDNVKVVDFTKLDETDIKLYLDRALPEIELNKDVVENASWTPDLLVQNCSFSQTAGRGILATTRGKVVIENNNFYKLWGPALLIEDDCNFWFESGYTKEIVFRNNVIDGCDFGPTFDGAPTIRYTPKVMDEKSKEFVHGKLILENNVFKNCYGETHDIHLEYLEKAEIRNNIFDKPFTVTTDCVGEVVTENNIIE